MNNSSTKFTIEGFQDDELKIRINTFELQVSPDQFDIKFGKVYDENIRISKSCRICQ